MSPAAKAYLISGYPRSMRDVVEYTEKVFFKNMNFWWIFLKILISDSSFEWSYSDFMASGSFTKTNRLWCKIRTWYFFKYFLFQICILQVIILSVVLSLARMELENFFKNVMPCADYFDQSDVLVTVSFLNNIFFLN